MTTIYTTDGIFEVEEELGEIEMLMLNMQKWINLTLVPDPEAFVDRENDVARFFVPNIVMYI